MRAALGPSRVAEALLDAVRERLQELACSRRVPAAQKFARPSLQLAIRIGIPPLDAGEEVRQFLRRVGERIGPRKVLDLEIRRVRGRVIEMNAAFEAELGGLPGKPSNRNAIAEGIMKPPELRGIGLDAQSSVDQSLIVAVPRAEHHPMFTERNGLLVPIRGDVTHQENCHSTCGAAPPSSPRAKGMPQARCADKPAPMPAWNVFLSNPAISGRETRVPAF